MGNGCLMEGTLGDFFFFFFFLKGYLVEEFE